jgi:hypothetical protein
MAGVASPQEYTSGSESGSHRVGDVGDVGEQCRVIDGQLFRTSWYLERSGSDRKAHGDWHVVDGHVVGSRSIGSGVGIATRIVSVADEHELWIVLGYAWTHVPSRTLVSIDFSEVSFIEIALSVSFARVTHQPCSDLFRAPWRRIQVRRTL